MNLVFVTKYRRDVITDPILIRMEELIRETCEQMEFELIEFNGEHDYVHLMVSAHPKVAVSNRDRKEIDRGPTATTKLIFRRACLPPEGGRLRAQEAQ